MCGTLLHQNITLAITKTKLTINSERVNNNSESMAWSNEKLRFSCMENIGLKQLWKLVALDTNVANTTPSKHKAKKGSNTYHQIKTKVNTKFSCDQQQRPQPKNKEKKQIEKSVDYLANRDILTPASMSLLKFLAINALELSAPATPVLLQQQNRTTNNELFEHEEQKPKQQKIQGWMQLSGHPESIVPTTIGIVRKRVSSLKSDDEVEAYRQLSKEIQTSQIVPHFYGTQVIGSEKFIELQDLLAGFQDPCVMDIKLGCRTFLESEVTNETLRPDLYQKMAAIDANAPTPEEHSGKAITKLKYMLFRETMSSSHTKGFRIEALRLRGRAPVNELKTVRSSEQIAQTIKQFLAGRREVQKVLIQRLKHMRCVMESSEFFKRHEVVGSSIFIVYDDVKVGAWLIDFAKSRKLPAEIKINHRSDWVPGNREEGLLKGMDKLIDAFENVYSGNGTPKCLHI